MTCALSFRTASPNTAYTLRAIALALRGHFAIAKRRICWER